MEINQGNVEERRCIYNNGHATLDDLLEEDEEGGVEQRRVKCCCGYQ